jgi:hypothetical protein
LLAPNHPQARAALIATMREETATFGRLMAVALLVTGCATSPEVQRRAQLDCATYVHAKKEFKARINWCVRYAEVRDDALEVGVSWEVVRLEGDMGTIFQWSDEGNRRMYLTDEFGRRYDHDRVAGAALGSAHRAGSSRHGSFFFPLHGRQARSFLFHDEENGIAVRVRP